MRPTLSAVVVTYNSASCIERCLASLRQAVEHWGGTAEILVVDNASGDETRALMSARPDVRFLPQRLNLGFAAGVNVGLRACRGKLVLLLNPDCFLERGLDEMILCLSQRPEVAAAGPKIFDGEGRLSLSSGRFPSLLTELLENFWGRRLFPRSGFFGQYLYADWDRATDRRVDWLTGACLLLRLDALLEVGPMDEDYFLYTEEVDLQWRLAQAGYESRFLAGPRVVHLGGRSAETHGRGLLGGQLHAELVKSLTLFFRKHRGPACALVHRWMLTAAYLLRLGLTLPRGDVAKARVLGSVLRGLLLGHDAETAAALRLRP